MLWGSRESHGARCAAEGRLYRVSEAERSRDPAKVAGFLVWQACGMTAPCCGIPCTFSVVLQVIGRLAGWKREFLVGAASP